MALLGPEPSGMSSRITVLVHQRGGARDRVYA